jgi:hypothetical protein
VYLKRNIVLFLTILILIDDLDEEYEPEGQNEIKNEGPSQNTKAPEKISNKVIFKFLTSIVAHPKADIKIPDDMPFHMKK